MPKAALLTCRPTRRRLAFGTVLALVGGLVATGVGRIDGAGAAVTGTFDGSTSGFVASPVSADPTSFRLSSAGGTVVAGGAWIFWSAAAAHSTLVLNGPDTDTDTDTDGGGPDTDTDSDTDVVTLASDAELAIAGGRKVFSAALPSSFPTTTVFTTDLSATDQLAAVAVVTDGTSPRTFFHIERDLSAVGATGVSATFTGLPKPTVASGSALYGVIEATGSPTAGSSRFHSPESNPTSTPFTAGTSNVEANEVAVALDPAATSARVVLAGDADASFVRLYSGVSYAAPAPNPTATVRFVATGGNTNVTARNPGQSFDVLFSLANAAGAGPLRNATVTLPLPTEVTQEGGITEEGVASAGSTSGTGPVAITVTELLGGQTYSVRIPVVVNAGPGAGSTTEVSLAEQTLTYDDPSGSDDLTTQTSADSLDRNPNIDLTATLTPDASPVVLVGGQAQIGYRLSIANNGPDPATAATYEVLKPAGTDTYSFTGSGLACVDFNSTRVRCSLAEELAAGATAGPVTIRARATTSGDKTTSAFKLTAAPTFDTNTGNDHSANATVVVNAPNAPITLSGSSSPSPVALHDPQDTTTPEFTTTFTITNNNPAGGDAAEGITMSVDLPVLLAGEDAKVTGCSNVPAGSSRTVDFTCVVNSVAVGSPATVSLVFNVKTPGPKDTTVTVTSTTSTGAVTGSPATAGTTVVAQTADVAVDPIEDVVVQAGPSATEGSGTFDVTIRNMGQFPSIGPKVDVTLQDGAEFPSPATYEAGCVRNSATSVTCTVPTPPEDLDPVGNGSSHTFTLPVEVPATATTNPAGAGARGTATASPGLTDEPAGTTANNTQSFRLKLNRAPGVVADPAPYVMSPGELVIDVARNDTDADNTDSSSAGLSVDSLATTDPAASSGGTLEVVGGRKIRYVPPTSFAGDAVITFRVVDLHGGASGGSLPVKVRRFAASIDPAAPLDPATTIAAYETPTNTTLSADVTTGKAVDDGTEVNLKNGVPGLVLKAGSVSPEGTVSVDGSHATGGDSAGALTYVPITGFTSDPVQPSTELTLDTLRYTLATPDESVVMSGTFVVRVRNANPDGCTTPLLAETPTDRPVVILVVGKNVVDLNTGDKDGVVISDLLDPATPTCAAAAASAVAGAEAAPGEVEATAQGGTIKLADDLKSVEYTPKAQFAGEDSFVVQIVDPRGGASLMKGNVKVLNGDPQPFGPPVTVIQNRPQIVLDISDSKDPNNDKLSFTAADQLSERGGLVQVIENGTKLRYSPPLDYVGPDKFRYTVSDGTSSVSATLEIFVVADPDASAGGSSRSGSSVGAGRTTGRLPATGANSTSRGLAGAGVFGIGLLALGVGSRRRRSSGPLHLR